MKQNDSVSPYSYEYTELGYNIAYYRKHRKLTQEQLAEIAEMVDISRQHLGAIEAPNIIRPLSLDLLFAIARALEVEPYKLFRFNR